MLAVLASIVCHHLMLLRSAARQVYVMPLSRASHHTPLRHAHADKHVVQGRYGLTLPEACSQICLLIRALTRRASYHLPTRHAVLTSM